MKRWVAGVMLRGDKLTRLSVGRLTALVILCSIAGGLSACGESKERRLERYQKIAAEKLSSFGAAGVGLAAYQASDYQVALDQWKPLAEAGNADVQNFMGNLYLGVLTSPTERILSRPPKKDVIEALRWYRRAIEQGHVSAMENVAGLYARGVMVPKDVGAAEQLWSQAARRGSAWAALNLADLYKGTGIECGLIAGYAWYEIAEALGQDYGLSGRDELVSTMSPAQLEKARELARGWLVKHRSRDQGSSRKSVGRGPESTK